MHVRSYLSAALLCGTLVFQLGCQPPEEQASGPQSSGGDKTLTIAMIPKGTTHIFWKSVHFGAQRAAEEEGAEVQWRGPARESDRDEQISVVQSFLNKQVDGICLAPLDADALVRPVTEAGRGGVPVVVFDSGLSGDKKNYVSYVATDNYRGGQMAGETLATAMGEKGNVVLLRYSKGSESTHQREEGFLEAIGAYPNITILSSDQYAGTTAESAVDKAQQVFNKFSDQIDGVFAVCEPNAEGVMQALRDRKINGQVKFVAFDSSESLRNGLEAGDVSAIVLQDPVQMGYLSMKTIIAHIRGEEVDDYVDTGVYVATQENLSDEKIQELLNPEKA